MGSARKGGGGAAGARKPRWDLDETATRYRSPPGFAIGVGIQRRRRRAGQQPRGPCHLSTRAPGGTSGPQVARGTRAERRGRWHERHQDRRQGLGAASYGENMNLTLHVRGCN